MKKLYLCHTIYHLLITLIRADASEELDICLFDTIQNREEIMANITKSKFNISVFLLEASDDCRSISMGNYHEIVIFNDATLIGKYLRKNNIPYKLMEDGLNYYQYKKKYALLFNFLALFNIYRPSLGFSKCAKTIEVNSLEGIPQDIRRFKWREVSRKKIWEQLTAEQKLEIASIFGFRDFSQKYHGVLILTQPLYQDKWDSTISTEEEQFNFYKKIVVETENKHQVFLKVHPRDTVDYSALENVSYLEKNIPMEIYELVTDCHFTRAITHSSTVIDFLSCVDEKIILKNFKR